MHLPRFAGLAGRVFLISAAIVCAVLAAVLAIASYSGRRAAQEAERRSLEQAADLTGQLLAGRERSLAGGVRVFVQGPYFRSLVATRSHDDILDQTIEAKGQLDADWVFITDDRGTLLAKSDEPAVQGVAMGAIPLVAGALQGRTTSGYGVSRDTMLFQAVAVPIAVPVPGAAPVGVLVATQVIRRQAALDVRAATGADVVFYTMDTRGLPRVAATSLGSTELASAALPASTTLAPKTRPSGAAASQTADIGGVTYVMQGAAVTTSGGEIVGGFVVGRPHETTPAAIAGIRRSLLAAALLGLVLALVAAWSAARYITRPARTLALAAARALEGDYEAAARTALESTSGTPPDEIAALGRALGALLEDLREKKALVAMLRRAATTRDEEPREAPTDGGLDDRRIPPGRRSGAGRARGGPLARALAPTNLRMAPWTGGAAAPGTVIADRYALEEVLGSGGTGIVYKAADLSLGETVALKMLRPELVSEDTEAIEKLKHELRLTRRVSHRNVVRTYDFGSSGSASFLTMEYVEGASLAGVLASRGALPPDVMLALARQLARALQAAHEQGVMHGDLKPANILVSLDGLLKVTDFGLATLVRRPRTTRAREEAVTPPRLAGAVVGTPEYMAPELLLGGTPDVRSDLYAAGMVLHECLTGATPFQRDTPRAFLAQKLDPPHREPPASAPRAEPRTVEAIVAWMVAPDAADRPRSAASVVSALARLG